MAYKDKEFSIHTLFKATNKRAKRLSNIQDLTFQWHGADPTSVAWPLCFHWKEFASLRQFELEGDGLDSECDQAPKSVSKDNRCKATGRGATPVDMNFSRKGKDSNRCKGSGKGDKGDGNGDGNGSGKGNGKGNDDDRGKGANPYGIDFARKEANASDAYRGSR